eukprot:GGOE01056626.1.p1 GENE.GGOE01056626.1~~GGOE01056626.1.p1  ORF type:complete len:193 (+),score=42.36 GGOE01056626.1:178-756(+)
MFAGVKKWFIRKEPEAPPRPQTAPEPRERQPERIRFVNEDASNAQQEQQRSPEPDSPADGPSTIGGPSASVSPVGSPSPWDRTANPVQVLKPRSAPPMRTSQVLTKSRAQSAGNKVPKRFVQPSEFSLHSHADGGDAPLASSTFPFRHSASSSSTGPIDPLANDQPSFSQTQHTRLALDPFVEVDPQARGPL